MKNSTERLLKLMTSALAVIAVGCSDNKAYTPEEAYTQEEAYEPNHNGTEISKEAFEQVDFSGVWRRQYLADSSSTRELDNNGTPLTALEERHQNEVNVISIEEASPSSYYIDGCDTQGPLDVQTSSSAGSFDAESEDGSELKYYQMGDNYYRIDAISNNQLVNHLETKRLAESASFQLGELDFSITGYGDLSSTTVCGRSVQESLTLTDADTDDSVSFASYRAESNNYYAAAPYGASYVLLSFSFDEAVEIASYEITTSLPAESNYQTRATIESPEFANNMMQGENGTVEITAIRNFYISGSYNIDIDKDQDGNIDTTLVGTFGFDLR
ncbi:MAG: hypothetical protein KUG83_11300 [Gammaproteobacteria bacterium]|nr:hypothetical protein [Gammaproteobacteria bacterium]